MYLVKDCNLVVTYRWRGSDYGDPIVGPHPKVFMMDDAQAFVENEVRMWDRGFGTFTMEDNARLVCREMLLGDSSDDPGFISLIVTDNAHLETDDYSIQLYEAPGLIEISGNATVISADHLRTRSRAAGMTAYTNISDNATVDIDGNFQQCWGEGNCEVNISDAAVITVGEDWRNAADNDFTPGARVVVNMTGGEVHVGENWHFPEHYEAQGFTTYNLTSGLVTVGGRMRHETNDWIVNICGDAVIIIEGDHVDQILEEAENWEVEAITYRPELAQDGHWVACPMEDCRGEVVPRGNLMVDFNDVNPGATTIWVELALDEAWSPLPEDGATDVPAQGTSLCWCTPEVDGGIKDQHVFFSTDCDAVANRDPAAFLMQAGPSAGGEEICVPLDCLALCTTYCWAVDIQDHYTNIVRGPVWTFTTECCRMIEDFDSYTLDPWSLIYKAWFDGCGYWDVIDGDDVLISNGTGSCVNLGMDNTQDGPKAMIYTYENVEDSLWERDVNWSEATAEFDPPLDLDCSNDKALVIYFYGDAGNDLTDMWVKVNGVKSTYGANGEDPADIQVASWQDWNTKLSDFADGGADLSAVTEIAIGFGDDETNIAEGTTGMMLFDSIQTCATRCVPQFVLLCDTNGDCVIDWLDIKVIGDNWLTDLR
jgi:hypothetical protein